MEASAGSWKISRRNFLGASSPVAEGVEFYRTAVKEAKGGEGKIGRKSKGG